MSRFINPVVRILVRTLAVTVAVSALPVSLFAQSGTVLTGQAAFTDWNQQSPGIRHKITVADLPQPNPEEAVDNTGRRLAHRASWLQSHALRRRRCRSHAAQRKQAGNAS